MPGRNIIKNYDDNGFYHIYNRGVEKREIFLDDQDYHVFLSYLKLYLSPADDLEKVSPSKKLKNFFGEVELLCYCLMPNHYHMIIKQHLSTSIVGFIRCVSTKYAMYFNKKYKRSGHLFQGVYRAVTIDSEPQLIHLSRYIHRNPDPAGLNPAGLLLYPYSSLHNYLERIHQSWINHQEILSLFSKLSPNPYLSFLFETTDLFDVAQLLIDYDAWPAGLNPAGAN